MEDNPKVISVKEVKVKATHVAQQCPVCRGFGTLKYGAKICQGCSGKGWILVPAEEVEHGK